MAASQAMDGVIVYKRFIDFSRLSRFLLKHLMQLSKDVVPLLESIVGLSDAVERRRIKDHILVLTSETLDTWVAFKHHVCTPVFANSCMNWYDLMNVQTQTQIIMDSVRRNNEAFDIPGGDKSANNLKASFVLLRMQLAGPMEVAEDETN